ncbi:unnamed protein product [Symbiodinium sp. CCMP2456]|nr:unnamed protein product [Symbiodinium sp. CCMP2456]
MPVAAAESKASTEAPTAEDRVEEARDSAVVAEAEAAAVGQEALETAVAGAKEQGLDVEITAAEPTSGCNLFGLSKIVLDSIRSCQAARNLEGKLRSERSAFEAQSAKRDQELEQKTQEVRDRENELRKKEREVDSLRDQARKLEDQVRQERRASEDLEYKNQGLVQELHLRNRQLQEQSEEMANYIRELDAQSRGDIPSVIKEVRQAREEEPENALLKERLAKSEADVELLRQWKDHEGHR